MKTTPERTRAIIRCGHQHRRMLRSRYRRHQHKQMRLLLDQDEHK